MNGADYLAELLADVLHGTELSVLSHEWLIRGLLRYLRAQGDISLEDALGLTAPGRRSVNRYLATALRDHHLRAAAAAISLDPALSTGKRCQRLAEQVGRLVPIFDVHHRKQTKPLAEWPAWKCALFHAWKTGVEIPGTARGLDLAMKRTTVCSVHSDGLKVVASYAPQAVRNAYD